MKLFRTRLLYGKSIRKVVDKLESMPFTEVIRNVFNEPACAKKTIHECEMMQKKEADEIRIKGLLELDEFYAGSFFELNLDKVLIYGENTKYYNVIYEGRHIGFVGYAKIKKKKYAQIYIFKEKRGIISLRKIYKLLCEKDNITELHGKVDDRNKTSIKAHKDAGFNHIETYHIGVFKP